MHHMTLILLFQIKGKASTWIDLRVVALWLYYNLWHQFTFDYNAVH